MAHSPSGLCLPAEAQVQSDMRRDFKVIAGKHGRALHVSASWVGLEHVPSENVSGEEVRIRDSSYASVELEMS